MHLTHCTTVITFSHTKLHNPAAAAAISTTTIAVSISTITIAISAAATGWFGWSGAQPDGWCLPLLIFPCTINSRSSPLAFAHPGGPGKRAVKWLWCGGGGAAATTTSTATTFIFSCNGILFQSNSTLGSSPIKEHLWIITM